ncbi:alpha/beta fold hydrolase [Georgenia alba]|uniref:Alpha/beta fold hydrolase n=1 Tax=Georgenia alba TaxID=2233858 RepID=A0ABW2QAZ8_9MICO
MTAPLSLTRHGAAEGLPLVLLHAFPLDSRMWEGVIGELPEIPVITLDAPGFGASRSPRAVADAVGRPLAPSLKTYADAVAATLTGAGVDRAVVAGLSMGGYVALALAERRRALLAGVGLLDTKATADDADARANRVRVAEQAAGSLGSRAVAPMVDAVLSPTTHRQRPEVVATVSRWLAEAPPAGIAWAQRAMAGRPDRRSALDGLGVPALVLRGADDASSSDQDVETMAQALADVEVVVVPDAGHLSAVEDPGAVAAALRALHERAVRHEKAQRQPG